jgi:putative zinc finger protein
VNRCLTEGRRAFLERVAGIEGGGECERLAPMVSLLADGELDADEMRLLRPHLKTCLACRARLREYRAAPRRVAALVPPAAVAATGAGDGGPLRSILESLIVTGQDRVAALGERVHAATELATGQKLAVVAASAAAITGGGATVSQISTPDGAPERDRQVEVAPVVEKTPDAAASARHERTGRTDASAPGSAPCLTHPRARAHAGASAAPGERVRSGAGAGARAGAGPCAAQHAASPVGLGRRRRTRRIGLGRRRRRVRRRRGIRALGAQRLATTTHEAGATRWRLGGRSHRPVTHVTSS